MSILLFRPTPTAPDALDPPSRPRSWYAQLFASLEPRQQSLTPEQAWSLILANWHRTYKDLKTNGSTLPDL